MVMIAPSTTKKCPFCAEIIQADAIKCKHCMEMLDPVRLKAATANEGKQVQYVSRERRWNPGIAAVFSFFIPGLGQLYKGDVGSGVLWFLLVPLGYFLLVIPGIILHIICIATAASGDPYK